MPKLPLITKEANLEHSIIRTLQTGHEQGACDSKMLGPKSYSDWEVCVRALMRRFDIHEHGLDQALHTPCDDCCGIGVFRKIEDRVPRDITCNKCKGTGKLPF